MKKKPGRPPMTPGQPVTKALTMRITKEMNDQINAVRGSQSRSSWAREALQTKISKKKR